ncbi:MAG: DNA topoisomerase (ATP-hydrolyzing) subunit B [Rhodobacteraceae bacterium]|nr:DNA topoisomerase (ATP-hydrolyzing) subunit B [Paracoccaceae bacterium]
MVDKNYDSSNIKVLKGLEAVQKRPGMYIGDTDDGSGLHQMIFEVIDNSIDEALAGYCDTIDIIIHEDQSVTVIDNGRGIPVDMHPGEQKSAAEVILTVLHAGGKFDDDSYKVSGGLHGVGVSVVNALSETLELTVYKDGKIYSQEYKDSKPVEPLKINGETEIQGTKISFKPSKKYFTLTKYNTETLRRRLKELAFLNSGITIRFTDEAKSAKDVFKYDGGIIEYIKELTRKKTLIQDEIIYFKSDAKKITVEMAMMWSTAYTEDVLCFTNNIPQKDGGTHLSGFKASLTKTINTVFDKQPGVKKDKIDITGDDAREGITAIISVKMSDPKFSSQTKDKLVSSEVKGIVESSLNKKLHEFFEENPKELKSIIAKVYQAAKAREEARKAKDLIRRKDPLSIGNLPGKLADCQEKDPTKTELFIVEGDSAGGSAKQARDRKIQAILPLKGKILNTQRAQDHKVLSSSEIATLITALGCGFGADVELDNLRYGKIIIMTDADVDGAHIRTLLLTLFETKMKPLIDNGHVFIAQPPLYKMKKGKSEKYLKDDEELSLFINNDISSTYKLFIDGNESDPDDTRNLLNTFSSINNIVDQFSSKRDKYILHSMAFFESLNSETLKSKKLLSTWCLSFNEYINANTPINLSFELTPSDELSEDKYYLININKMSNGVNTEQDPLDRHFFSSDAYLDLVGLGLGIYTKAIFAYSDLGSNTMSNNLSLTDCFNKLISLSKSSITLQRYKGLGEMNPNQLEETTMNVKSRTLLKVLPLEDGNLVVVELMGDDVEMRKQFIKQKYSSVKNLDI